MDSLRSSVSFAKDMGFIGGNRNGYYINGDKENKFTLRNMHEEFKLNRDLYKSLYGAIIPVLETRL